uniref:oleoyl-[acyl-carrier-protein] hydrolase n=1 Tax=Melopsittacus undulatus TaxID=13146 RepID=A0A8V5GC37_MELUD
GIDAVHHKSRMEKLVACPHERPDALYRLICFPWVGSGAYFAQWGSLFSGSIEASSVSLPGRESCQGEELQEKPFAFFGHSFGSYVSLAVALHLKEKYGLEPIPFTYVKTAHEGKDEDILAYLEILGGTPSELMQNKDSKKHLINTLREDSRVLHTWSFYNFVLHLYLYFTVLFLSDSAWNDLTSGGTSFYKLPGGHFCLLDPSNEIFLVKQITSCMEHAGLRVFPSILMADSIR